MPEAAVGDDLEAFTSDVNLVDRLLPELSRASTALQTLASQQQALLDQVGARAWLPERWSSGSSNSLNHICKLRLEIVLF